MNRWCGKVAVVTGASSGIGAATAVRLAEDGCITIGLARRVERIEQLKCTLKEGHKGDLIAMQCDCSLEGEVRNVFECITSTYGNIQILVNAAGVNRKFLLLDGCNSEEMRNVVDTNLMGPVYCIREAYKSMKKTKSGHIININSILGHKVIYFGALEVPPMNMYPSTKYAMTAMTEVLRQELQVKKTPYIKITSLSPGLVRTGMLDPNESRHFQNNILEASDIAGLVVMILSTPEHVQISELMVRSVCEQQ